MNQFDALNDRFWGWETLRREENRGIHNVGPIRIRIIRSDQARETNEMKDEITTFCIWAPRNCRDGESREE